MRVGYPCANRTAKLHGNHTFRKKNFSLEKLKETTQKNLDHVSLMLQYNVKNNFKFFRIGSTFVPFASHELCSDLMSQKKNPFDWRVYFKQQLKDIGQYVNKHGMRISMHPDHFVLLNSPKDDITEKSIRELQYHTDLMNAMELDSTHKFQIHVGGVYGDKESAIERFIEKYKTLNDGIKQRLVIENDDHLFSLKDCIQISQKTGVPILFDTLHHECLNNGEDMIDAFKQAAGTWNEEKDGIPMIDYSSQDPKGRKGKHAPSLDLHHFTKVVCKKLMSAKRSDGKFYKFDIMLEIKDKELAALKCIASFDKYKSRNTSIEAGEEVSEEKFESESESDPEGMKSDETMVLKTAPPKRSLAKKRKRNDNDVDGTFMRITRSKAL